MVLGLKKQVDSFFLWKSPKTVENSVFPLWRAWEAKGIGKQGAVHHLATFSCQSENFFEKNQVCCVLHEKVGVVAQNLWVGAILRKKLPHLARAQDHHPPQKVVGLLFRLFPSFFS